MVTIRGHGGSCCGARHLAGFGAPEEANPDLISTAQAGADPQRMTEVILNGNQVANSPRTLQRLADIGYVLVGHYINGNHGSHNYVFHRCDARLPLIDARGNCVIPAWTGSVLTPRLEGNLPALTARTAGNRADPRYLRPGLVGPPAYVPENPIRVGDRVRVNYPTSRRHNNEFVVIRIVGPTAVMNDGGEFSFTFGNLVNLTRPPQPAPAGRRVVWAGREGHAPANSGHTAGRRPLGSLGTIHRAQGNQFFIRWDNPADIDTVDYFCNRNQITVLTDAQAAENPRVLPVADAAFPATRHAVPADWEAVVGAAGLPPRPVPAVEVPAREVFATFHNVYRDGRRGAGYDTLVLARASRAVDGRVDRRGVFSDGTIVWTENFHG